MKNRDKVISLSKNLTILYLEESSATSNATLATLKDFFKKIIVAKDGEDGYKKFQENQVDLVITDVKLDGIDMIKKIKVLNSETPVLILSLCDKPSYFQESIKVGVDGYLLKPLDLKQFTDSLLKITKKIKLTQDLESASLLSAQYQAVTDHAVIISKADPSGKITYVNDEFCEISGYTREELLEKNHKIIRHPDMPKEIFKEMWHTIKTKKKIWKGIIRNISKSRQSYYVDTTITPILDYAGNIVEYIALRNNITHIMSPKKQLEDAIDSTQNPLIVFMKIEDFSNLEDFYSDAIINEIQNRAKECLEKQLPVDCKFEKIYQLQNGEYAMMNEKSICLKDENLFLSRLKSFQERVKKSIINIENIEYDLSIIISVVYDSELTLKSAKIGIIKLLQTKEDFIVANNFSQMEQERAEKNMRTISIIKSAIQNSRIISYFQPIINNRTEQIEKYESLVRLVDEKKRVLPPSLFLDVAKRGKYYSQITNIVLDNSFAALKKTEKEISINLSALDIELPIIRSKILRLLEENRASASRVVLELLEDEEVKDLTLFKKFIVDVKNLGVKIAIDDFGAGYSNFERLLDYQPDILKIDGSLIRNIETNAYSLSIVKTIVAFAKEQKIKTVAEFIENEAIFNITNKLGVDYSQGYYFGKPEVLH